MRDDELLAQVQRDQIREILREVLSERDALAAAEKSAQEKSEAEHLASIRRRDLSPKQVSDLVDRLGVQGYLALPYGEPDQARDANGPFRR